MELKFQEAQCFLSRNKRIQKKNSKEESENKN